MRAFKQTRLRYSDCLDCGQITTEVWPEYYTFALCSDCIRLREEEQYREYYGYYHSDYYDDEDN